MILYFSGTGNCLAIARQIAERIGDQVMPLYDAVRQDLTEEKRIGFVFPSYDFNMPPAVRNIVPRLRISQDAYVFAVIPCGAQAGNCIWTLRHLLRKQGVTLAYSHKIRVPDNSAIAFGRNPNDQTWKFERFIGRLEKIITDVQAERHKLHFSAWSLIAYFMGLPRMEQWMIRTFRPQVSEEKCIGCKTCYRICPMRNIVMSETEDDKSIAAIGPHCTVCLACVHVCPQQAIMLGDKPIVKSHQYRHPQVKLKDLLKR